MSKRFVSWSAVSSLPQAKKVSLDDQLKTNRQHVERHQGRMVAELEVPGESRDIVLFEDAARRIDAYRQLKELIDTKAFDVLIFLDRSRLGRTAALSMAVAELCNRAGIILYETDAPPATLEFAQADYDDLLIGAIKSVGAQQELRKFKQRRESGMAGRVQRGEFPGEVPWPWVEKFSEDGKRTVEVDERGREALLMIRDRYLINGDGLRVIAEHLNQAGYPSPRGGLWAGGNVVWIVRNVWRYAGYMELNKKSSTGLTYIKARSKWPAILTDDEATAIQAERHRRWFARGSVHSTHRFSQCVWCAVCNTKMNAAYVSSIVKGKKYVYEMYRCPSPHSGKSVMAWKVEASVRATINHLAGLDDLAAYIPDTVDRSEALQAQRAMLQERMSEYQGQLERADDAYTTGAMGASRYQRQVDRIEKQMALLTVQIADVDAAFQAEQMAGRRLDRLEEIVSTGLTMLTLAEIPTANAYFRRLIRVWVRDNEVSSVDII
jgi:DNA invertase Pin-like site-specific DNA recombinase